MRNQRGSALLLVIIVFATLFALFGTALYRGSALVRQIQVEHREDAALNLAEAGIHYAFHKLVNTDRNYYGESNIQLDPGTFSLQLSYLTPSGMIEILSTGQVAGIKPGQPISKTLKVLVQIPPDEPEASPIVHSLSEAF